MKKYCKKYNFPQSYYENWGEEGINYLNSDHISNAEPGGKNLRQDRTREVIVSKCRCLSLQPSGPVFL